MRFRPPIWITALLWLLLLSGIAVAAQSPFGIATPDGGGGGFGGPLGPFFAWVAARQNEFYRELTATLAAARESGTAAWLLLGLSFLYGIFHAAGPGHGKAVISSYLIATNETAKQGIAISFAAAFVQAVTAVLVVGIAAAILNVTAVTMTETTDWLEIGSYGLIVLVGAWLLWTKAFGRGHHHHHHDHDHGGHHHHAHAETKVTEPDHAGELAFAGHPHDDHHHHHGAHCRHHAGPDALPETGNVFARAWTAILGVGIRPCSGAIIVLVFALSQGLFAAGIAATFAMALGTGITVAVLALLAVSAKDLALRLAGRDSARGHRVLRVIEIAAALVVLLFGLVLLGGALSAHFAG